ncbi:MAG: DUF1570 domain-containing protein [Planctomycetota bacterium]|nr:DUF1570 domain-containing protein [Planctomycetota bacterium]
MQFNRHPYKLMQEASTKAARSLVRSACCYLLACWLLGWPTTVARSMETVEVEQAGSSFRLRGEIIVEATDGGMILRDRQGKLWPLQPDQIKKRATDDVPFSLMKPAELSKEILKELPAGFSIHKTKHYLICYNTSKSYAQWCGALFERLFRAYNNYWKRRDLAISTPEMPLVAIVCKDKQTWHHYAGPEVGTAVDSIDGYYNLITNRIATYDLTANPRTAVRTSKSQDASEINRLLSLPQAGQLVATVIHEATHQIAFNCGIQQRLSDIPIWLNEGMAMFFETPDLRSKKGWRGMGEINLNRLQQFQNYLQRRPDDSLYTLIVNGNRMQGRSEDQRFQGQKGMLDAYSEAWALTYYLLTYRQDAFVKYLMFTSEKKPGRSDSEARKIEDFEKFFGDLQSLDQAFLERMQREIKRNARRFR